MQLTLEIELPDNKTLDNFNWTGNDVLHNQLKMALEYSGEHFYYLWGTEGVGKTHLLQAVTSAAGDQAMYLPLGQFEGYGAEIFEGIDALDFICIDDIQLIAGNSALQEALFHLYNRIRDNGRSFLFISGNKPISQLGITLPDLSSRLTWGLVFQIEELSEDAKLNALHQYAKDKGFELPLPISQYLLRHCQRNMHDLVATIDTLDKASLAQKRRLTIPFVKTILEHHSSQ